ncbi:MULTISPECIES: hypothetical protein [Sphingobium]|uniref:hypothetical protein n=1 Tax=Sphingobium TaxID=165695 RepID=UPI0011150464|nr:MULTISPECIES: hypothetical protein [Sphingobium]WQE06229.1 hypothetical protein U0025_18245 [Sphingobium yanoikuyae]
MTSISGVVFISPSLAGTVTFTADRGFTGDGATGYLNLGEAHGAAGQFAWRDSCSAGAWCNLAGGTAGLIAHLGQAAGTYRTSIFAHSAGNDSFRLADSTGDTLRAGTSRTGHRSIARSGPTSKLGFYAGAQVAAVTTASTGLSSLPMVGLRSNTSFAPDRLAALWSGDGAIVGAKAAAIHDRLNTFLTAIGAA